MATSQSILYVTILIICLYLKNTVTEGINNSTFFQNVSQLVNTKASPKHPQSDIGLAKANHNVTAVINSMKNILNTDASLRLIPKRK